MTVRRLVTILLLCCVLVAGCKGVRQKPTEFHPGAADGRIITMNLEIPVLFTNGRSSIIVSGSKWQVVGATPEGDVYKPLNQTFKIPGIDKHEAWLVISNNQLVGFYLPGPKNFYPYEPAMTMMMVQ